MKRYLLLCVVLLLAASAVSAQDEPFAIKVIPLDSIGYGMELSPTGDSVAVYEHFVFYEDAPTDAQLPVRVLNLQTGEVIGSLSGHTDWVTALDFTPDGSRAVTFHRNGDIFIWDQVAGEITNFPTYAMGGAWLQLTPDGSAAMFPLRDTTLAMLDIETRAITRLFGQRVETLAEYSDAYTDFEQRGNFIFTAAALSPDGAWLATTTMNDEVIVWDVATGEQRTLRPRSEDPAQFAVRSLTFTASGALVYFDQESEMLHQWDVESGEEIRAVTAGYPFALSPDETTVAWADRETQSFYIAPLDATDDSVLMTTLPDTLAITPNVTELAFTPDGSELIIGGFHAPDGDNAIYRIALNP